MTDEQNTSDETDYVMMLTEHMTQLFAEASQVNGGHVGFALFVFRSQGDMTQCIQTSNVAPSVVRHVLLSYLASTKDLKDEDAREVKITLHS